MQNIWCLCWIIKYDNKCIFFCDGKCSIHSIKPETCQAGPFTFDMEKRQGMTIGTEHEYSINDRFFSPLPISDVILSEIAGSIKSEVPFGEVTLSKELQKTVLEFIPNYPADSLFALEKQVYSGIRKFHLRFGDRYRLLGLGMHPLLTLNETEVWNHNEGEYYTVYDRLFNIRQHGWLNIQALQINLSYSNDQELIFLYNRIRSLLPYLIAVSASSPFVEGRNTGSVDNRLMFYRENQKEIPQICNRLIPERIVEVKDYLENQQEIYRELEKTDAHILCEEWLNSSGLIIRFSRRCIEVKAIDEQECVRSDMAVCAFLRALVRARDVPVETDRAVLLDLTELAIQNGTGSLKPELERLLKYAWNAATNEEKKYLQIIEDRIVQGSIAEQIQNEFKKTGDMMEIIANMGEALRTNQPYGF